MATGMESCLKPLIIEFLLIAFLIEIKRCERCCFVAIHIMFISSEIQHNIGSLQNKFWQNMQIQILI